MVHFGGINTHLVVQNTALPEYSLPSDELCDLEPHTAAAYVEVVPNSPYRIFFEIPARIPLRLSNAFVFRIFVDGKLVTDFYSSDTRPDGSVIGYLPPEHHELLRFPHVAVDHGKSKLVADAGAWEEKELVLQISQGRASEAEPSSVEAVGDSDSILAFTFKYRPRLILMSHLHLVDADISNLNRWDLSTGVAETSNAHAADHGWKKNLRRNENSELYCYCRKIRPEQSVVTCDNDACPYESFHSNCVGVTKEPDRWWFCPNCRELPPEKVEVAGRTKFFGVYADSNCGSVC